MVVSSKAFLVLETSLLLVSAAHGGQIRYGFNGNVWNICNPSCEPQCAALLPEEPCFKFDSFETCYGPARMRPSAKLRTRELDYEDIDEEDEIDSIEASSNSTKVELDNLFLSAFTIPPPTANWKSALRPETRSELESDLDPDTNINLMDIGFRPLPDNSASNMIEVGGEVHVWDPTCCRLTHACYNYIYAHPNPQMKSNELKELRIVDTTACCLQLMAYSCKFFNDDYAYLMDLPTKISPPPQCSNGKNIKDNYRYLKDVHRFPTTGWDTRIGRG